MTVATLQIYAESHTPMIMEVVHNGKYSCIVQTKKEYIMCKQTALLLNKNSLSYLHSSSALSHVG